jgi:Holliday junction resolvase
MASRGRGARIKGATFERQLAKYFTEHTDFEAKRGIGQSRSGGSEVSDVDMPIIHIEAKRHKRCHIKAALKQAIEDANINGKIPVAITKDDREEILCTMLLDDWIHLFNAYAKNNETEE